LNPLIVQANFKPMNTLRKISIAPMMDCTDKFYRYFFRLISKKSYLYTEMVNTGAVLHGDRERFLGFDEVEHPIGIQLGGSNPQDLAEAAQIAQEWGYDEVNLNVGCPSDRVQSGFFGACLMAKKELVNECLNTMSLGLDIPVTVKTRIGIDEMDSWEFFKEFVDTLAAGGCRVFIIHARKAWLSGLSPKENRTIPELKYEWVYRIKEEYPELEFSINGGITELSQIQEHLKYVDGVMIGREAYSNPWLFSLVDEHIYGMEAMTKTRHDIAKELIPFIEQQLKLGHPLNRIVRHTLGLFHGVRGGRAFRRHLSENMTQKNAGVDIWRDAISLVDQ
jgi:tRNA-dihydrouridine synthase A